MSYSETEKEIRVYNNYSLPFDPANFNTMAEYNLSLCIFETLFEFENGTEIKSSLISDWNFDDKKMAYSFKISDKAKWSDGKSLTSEDVQLSLERLKKVAVHQYNGLNALLSRDLSSGGFEIKDPSRFVIYVESPTQELHKRLAAAMIVIVRKDLLDQNTLLVNRHDISLGSYYIAIESDPNEILLLRNKFYHRPNTEMAEIVRMRNTPKSFSWRDIVKGTNHWPNLILDQSFIDKEQFDVLKSRMSFWTRPVDRILLLNPTPKDFRKGRDLIKWLGYDLSIEPIDFSHFPNTFKAESLQPPGFILYDPIKYKKYPKPNLGKKIQIAYFPNIPFQLVQARLKQRGIEAEFIAVSVNHYFNHPGEYDFLLSSFGAADPSPIIWLNMVLQNDYEFIGDYDGELEKKYVQFKKISSDLERNSKLKSMLKDAGERGFYLPLAHFSSVAIHSKKISNKDIKQTDETIDISKLRLQK